MNLLSLALKSCILMGIFFVGTKGFVCDAPARSFLTSVVPHNSYYVYHKCFLRGEYLKNQNKRGGRILYPDCFSPIREDLNFQNSSAVEYKNHFDNNKKIDR